MEIRRQNDDLQLGRLNRSHSSIDFCWLNDVTSNNLTSDCVKTYIENGKCGFCLEADVISDQVITSSFDCAIATEL